MYKVIEWSKDLDLTDFYNECAARGFVNNSSQKVMVDCFNNEREWNVWILYKDFKAVGSVAAHSFDDVVPGSYRILTRVCTFGEARPTQGMVTLNRFAKEHKNLSDQFLIEPCLEWVNGRGRVFATSNKSKEASQRLVHNHYFPALEEIGLVEKYKEDFEYRNTVQTVWEIFPDKFIEHLNKFERW